jgi:predicted O-linked N-acetylglucosamine transferase (SPINDLY family)
MLDTHPYGGHTGSSDALWAGVPVLTLVGETFASRVAASLLSAVGLPTLAARTEAEYIATAGQLIEDGRTLAAYRSHLVSRRMSFPLFDISAYARDFEEMLFDMVRHN